MTDRKNSKFKIEAGDLVEVVAGPDAHWIGMVGVFDQVWNNNGVKYVVIDPAHDEEFTYATEIKLYKKGK